MSTKPKPPRAVKPKPKTGTPPPVKPSPVKPPTSCRRCTLNPPDLGPGADGLCAQCILERDRPAKKPFQEPTPDPPPPPRGRKSPPPPPKKPKAKKQGSTIPELHMVLTPKQQGEVARDPGPERLNLEETLARGPDKTPPKPKQQPPTAQQEPVPPPPQETTPPPVAPSPPIPEEPPPEDVVYGPSTGSEADAPVYGLTTEEPAAADRPEEPVTADRPEEPATVDRPPEDPVTADRPEEPATADRPEEPVIADPEEPTPADPEEDPPMPDAIPDHLVPVEDLQEPAAPAEEGSAEEQRAPPPPKKWQPPPPPPPGSAAALMAQARASDDPWRARLHKAPPGAKLDQASREKATSTKHYEWHSGDRGMEAGGEAFEDEAQKTEAENKEEVDRIKGAVWAKPVEEGVKGTVDESTHVK